MDDKKLELLEESISMMDKQVKYDCVDYESVEGILILVSSGYDFDEPPTLEIYKIEDWLNSYKELVEAFVNDSDCDTIEEFIDFEYDNFPPQTIN